MKKIGFIVLICILYAFTDKDKACSTISGRVENPEIKEVTLWEVMHGEKRVVATSNVAADGSYGFLFKPAYEGFYVIGKERCDCYRLYLKPGDDACVNIIGDKAELFGNKNSRENKLLYEWKKLAYEPYLRAVRFVKCPRGNYRDFFPAFTTLLPKAEVFKQKINSGNKTFDALLKRVVEMDIDEMATNFMGVPASVYPQDSDYPEYYKTLVSAEKFKDTTVLCTPNGMWLLNRYLDYATRKKEVQNFADRLLGIPNLQVRGELVLEQAKRYQFYEDYLNMQADYGSYFVTDDQKQRAEAIGKKLYNPNTGKKAMDFTYPDVEGKKVSLSDFKGKVVLVDAWATWCGPCKSEFPSLKKLEKEFHGKEVVFLGVSLDENANVEKWRKMVKEAELGGVQVLAGGFSSEIAKNYQIKSIPRFIVFDKKGNIVSINAPRPSNPKLKQLLEAELKK